MKFSKGLINGGKLVVIDEMNKRDIMVPGGVIIQDVSEDIRCDKGDRVRFKSDVLQFNQVYLCALLFFSKFLFSYIFFFNQVSMCSIVVFIGSDTFYNRQITFLVLFFFIKDKPLFRFIE
jgi:hypothetical protein